MFSTSKRIFISSIRTSGDKKNAQRGHYTSTTVSTKCLRALSFSHLKPGNVFSQNPVIARHERYLQYRPIVSCTNTSNPRRNFRVGGQVDDEQIIRAARRISRVRRNDTNHPRGARTRWKVSRRACARINRRRNERNSRTVSSVAGAVRDRRAIPTDNANIAIGETYLCISVTRRSVSAGCQRPLTDVSRPA